jgi:pyrimidine-nucleoside phosphorylase/thymidine phosphorylase
MVILPAEVIGKKRDGVPLTKDEIFDFVLGYSRNEIPDYQMAALAMAIFFRSMNAEETSFLTEAMLNSGDRLNRLISEVPRVGKHSTGGLGDKTSLILAPLLACFPVHVPKLSGRGLGITGGTLDKLESIPGFRTNLTPQEIDSQLRNVGCVITGATNNIVPADKKLYSLRDVTATVPSIPLIASSIMSKKLAESLDALVLDVKFGTGAFMASRQQAEVLSQAMIDIGNHMNVATDSVLSDMNQPLGNAVGNACEVNEALEVLRGNGPSDVEELVLQLCVKILVAAKLFSNSELARLKLESKLRDGSAMERFEKMVTAQGGILPARSLPTAQSQALLSQDSGRVIGIDGQKLGLAIIQLGGGRRVANTPIDPRVGLIMEKRIGEYVEAHEPLLRILASEEKAQTVRPLLLSAFTIEA